MRLLLHNCIFGFIFIIIVYIVVFIIVLSIYIRCKKRHKRKAYRRTYQVLKYLCHPIILLKKPLTWIIIIPLCAGFGFASQALGFTHHENLEYSYESNDLAIQKSSEILFSPEDNAIGEKEELLYKLHIKPDYLNADMTVALFDYFYSVCSGIYVNGTGRKPEERFNWQRTEPFYLLINNHYFEAAARERPKWENPFNLYWYGWNLTQVLMTDTVNLEAMTQLEITADLISANEMFLRCSNRAIDTNGTVINVEYISLVNGKLLLKLIEHIGLELPEYGNCLTMEAYQCFCQGTFQCKKNNKLYLKLVYYSAIAGHRVLDKISKNDDPVLYNTVKNKVMGYYTEAQELLNNNDEFYETESVMDENITSGLILLATQ